MPRVRDFDRTRSLLIDAAGQLFANQGYDRTAVEAIIRQASVSKGAFYHHFASKDEILDAVTERMVAEAMDAIGPAVAERSIGALARLNRFFGVSRAWSISHLVLLREMLVVLYRDENAHMRRKIESRSAAVLVPMLADIIHQGLAERIFDPLDADETASLILRLAWVMRETHVRQLVESGDSPETLAAMQRRVDNFIDMVERMLGAPKGTIERPLVTEVLASGDPDRSSAAGAGVAGGQ
jgi:AcrR family transcriptional regulator